ncbi:hypothetical protein JHD46_05430 [Sulfurimonas sp. SAG-AH-194-C20]|nr:hypothetical protein [Sulfurimonas sp. SAG-AH-194-C20]MDF1879081.1 hypothetical protein [Sulfurimonas sp. SAG-AH-194-C20]
MSNKYTILSLVDDINACIDKPIGEIALIDILNEKVRPFGMSLNFSIGSSHTYVDTAFFELRGKRKKIGNIMKYVKVIVEFNNAADKLASENLDLNLLECRIHDKKIEQERQEEDRIKMNTSKFKDEAASLNISLEDFFKLENLWKIVHWQEQREIMKALDS